MAGIHEPEVRPVTAAERLHSGRRTSHTDFEEKIGVRAQMKEERSKKGKHKYIFISTRPLRVHRSGLVTIQHIIYRPIRTGSIFLPVADSTCRKYCPTGSALTFREVVLSPSVVVSDVCRTLAPPTSYKLT